MKLFILLLSLIPTVTAVVDPLTWGLALGGAVGLSGLYAGYKSLQCSFDECCVRYWISPDVDGMKANLSRSLHGQHLVKDVVIKSIKAHVRKSNPQKPLVLSFHGWTGGGKTFVSKIISQHLYKKGFESGFVHFYSPTIHFPHENSAHIYKENLVNWIKGNISTCPQSLFIFDEVDKMPSGLFDAIKPYLDYHQHIDGVISRHAIFIFLSNTGGTDITNIAIQHWKKGGIREDIALKTFTQALSVDAFNREGGFKRSSLIDSNLIDHFIPFLPMERRHVKLCVIDELRRRDLMFEISDATVDKITDQLDYYPPDSQLFSKQGCKRIEKLVDLELET